MSVKADTEYPLPGGEGSFKVVDIRSDIMHLGPAVFISIQPKNGKPTEFWCVYGSGGCPEKITPSHAGLCQIQPFRLCTLPYFPSEGLKTRYYTGLQANRDPGVPIVWAGCFLMVSGLFVTFFMSHKRMWVRVLELGATIRIEVAGTTNKNPVGLQNELQHLIINLGNEFDKKG